MANATVAILITLDPAHEGGFQKNPKDRANWTGGEIGKGTLVGTNGGITALDLPGEDIEHLTLAQKIAFYMERYWKPLYTEINSQEVANKLFDMSVLFGISEAVGDLQRALPIYVDGIFGTETLLLTNEAPETQLLADFKAKLLLRAEETAIAKPVEAEFLPDWKRRIQS